MKVQRALISAFDKRGVELFARGLTDMGVTVISTGGTAKLLKDSGIPVTLVEEVTGFPEILDGRVKTMHPQAHGRGSRAARRARAHGDHQGARHRADRHGRLQPYPSKEVAGRRGVEDEVGSRTSTSAGPSMIRAAAKNHAGVAVVTSHEDYEAVLGELKDRASSPTTRFASSPPRPSTARRTTTSSSPTGSARPRATSPTT